MPPIDWPIIQSALLCRVLPSGLAAMIVLGLVYWLTRSETWRSIGSCLALIAGLAAGNIQDQLVPFSAIHPIEVQSSDETGQERTVSGWEIETGWYALFSATLVAAVGGLLIDSLARRPQPIISGVLLNVIFAAVCAAWLTPWDELKSRPWMAGLVALAIVSNAIVLQRVGQSPKGPLVPLALALVWCGSAMTVLIFAHSARFADLATVISCALGGLGILTWLYQQRPAGLYLAAAAWIPGLMLGGFANTYSEVPTISFALVALAPSLLGFVYWGKARTWLETRPVMLLVGLLVPCVIAAGLAIRAEM